LRVGRDTDEVRRFLVVEVAAEFELKLKYDQIPGRCRTSTLLDMEDERRES
jgi:hypothetical protein